MIFTLLMLAGLIILLAMKWPPMPPGAGGEITWGEAEEAH